MTLPTAPQENKKKSLPDFATAYRSLCKTPNPSTNPQAIAFVFSFWIESFCKTGSFRSANLLWKESQRFNIWDTTKAPLHEACRIRIYHNFIRELLLSHHLIIK